MESKRRLLLVMSAGVIALFVVVSLIYMQNTTQIPRNRPLKSLQTKDEIENATVVLDVSEDEVGEAPGHCKVSFISKSQAYPVVISDIDTFYEFSGSVAICNSGNLTVINPETEEEQSLSYVVIVLDSDTDGIEKVDATTEVPYVVEYTFGEDVLHVSIAIEPIDDLSATEEVVRNILLREISEIFNDSVQEDLFDTYGSLADMGLQLEGVN